MRINIILLLSMFLIITGVYAADIARPINSEIDPWYRRDKDSIAYINGTNICSGNGTCIINTGNNSNISLDDYAKLDGTTGSFYDSSFKDSISTALRILYNQDGNPLCTWHNALGTGFDCVTLSQNGNTVLDTSNFVSYVNETYGNNYCENATSIVIGAYDDC